MTLSHFSEDAAIESFTPRPVLVPSRRPPGCEWLNGPLIWAIDDWHQPMYLFPGHCPRILIWRTAGTTAEDTERHWGTGDSRMIAFVERGWVDRLRSASICRYELPAETFVSLEDAGMWVSKTTVRPLRMEMITDLPAALQLHDVELRPRETLCWGSKSSGVHRCMLAVSAYAMLNAGATERVTSVAHPIPDRLFGANTRNH